jgi:hypothetical protein
MQVAQFTAGADHNALCRTLLSTTLRPDALVVSAAAAAVLGSLLNSPTEAVRQIYQVTRAATGAGMHSR